MRRLVIIFVLVFLACAPAFAQGPDYSISGSVWGDVYFARGGYELSPEANKTLEEVAGWIKKHPGAMVLLAGYDEKRTPEKESIELGWKRAGAVRDRLVSLGADPDKVNMISFGNTRVTLTGDSEESYSKSRRVRYRVVGPADTEKMEGMPSGVCQRCKK
jgi:peptidoglycan-associated lipoprotein